jgi:hypothetical protein
VLQIKARQVCGGNRQIEGIDYKATYVLTTHMGHFCLALLTISQYNFEIYDIDVCTAFLGVELEEEICMHSLQGYVCLLQNVSQYKYPRTKISWKLVFGLRKSL